MAKKSAPAPSSSSRSASPTASSSSSRSGESSDSEAPVEKTVITTKADRKKKGKAPARNDEGARSKYAPPKGFKLAEELPGQSSVGWTEFAKDNELELWAVRIPEGVKTKYLNGVTIQLGSKSSSEALGSVTVKKVDWDIKLAEAAGGAEEMRSLVPLLPKTSSGNKYFQAPRSIKRNLVLTRSLPPTILSHLPSSTTSLIDNQPSPVPGAIYTAAELLKPLDPTVLSKKKVREQPSGLKFRLELGGSGAVGGKGLFDNKPPPKVVEEVVANVVDVPVEEEGTIGASVKNEVMVDGEEKKKKKRDKSESPKKKKRSTTDGEETPRKKSKTSKE